MNKIRLLWAMIILLLLSNLLLAAFIYLRRPPRHEGPRNVIIEQLHFDKSQVAQYDQLIQAHRDSISAKERDLLRIKNELYAYLIIDEDTAKSEFLLGALNATQLQIERIHYRHFRDIKTLCRPDQSIYFEQLTQEIAGLFMSPRKNKPHEHR